MTPTTPSPISAVKEFEALCDMIPEDAYWGMPLTPDLVRHIRDCSTAPISDQAADELLPCPFCGGTLGFAAVVHKDGCYISMAMSSFKFTREQYDEAWNRLFTLTVSMGGGKHD